jgi:predicted DNA-binding transcriptional regulator AlpA
MSIQQESTAIPGNKLIDVRGVATMLGCSTRHVHRLRDSGRMPAPVKLGALIRWSEAKLAEWIASGCPAAKALRRADR